jgi:CHAP domain/Putative peptidoglycan binding domain
MAASQIRGRAFWRLAMGTVGSLIGGMPAFIALMAGISVAVERIVEMLKGAVPLLATKWAAHDEIRAGILQLIATLCGALMAGQMPEQVKNALPAGWASNDLHWPAYALMGLLSCAGSGAWNHLLDILGAVKTKQEAASIVAEANLPPSSSGTGSQRTGAPATNFASRLVTEPSAARVAPAPPPAKIAPRAMAAAAGASGGSIVISSASSGSPMPSYQGRVISVGDRNAGLVQLVQHRLNMLGCGPLNEDGVFGAETEAAVELFQMRSPDHFGLPLRVDRRVGPLTWASLFALPEIPEVEATASSLLGTVLKVAGTQVGVMEDPLGSNRGPQVDEYLRSVGIDPTTGSYPWCAAFVYWCFRQAATSLGVADPVIRTGSVLEHWEKAGAAGIPRLTSAKCQEDPSLVKPGVIFVIINSAGTGHTGLVEGVTGTYLTTIEGNTNDNGSREGIGVFRRKGRTIADINRGFICY